LIGLKEGEMIVVPIRVRGGSDGRGSALAASR
jgi:hypothetical protein